MTTHSLPRPLTPPLSNRQQLRHRLALFLARGPGYHVTYGRWRWKRWRAAGRRAPGPLSAGQFWRQLDLEQPALAAVKRASLAQDEGEARAQLALHWRNRTTPAWFFAPAEMEALAHLVPADQRAATLRAAEAICRNEFQFRHAPAVRFDSLIDWRYQPDGNVDWNWDLNRHLYFDTLGRAYAYSGDERYARKFGELVLDWSARNRPGVREPAWSSVFELAVRAQSWLWGFHYFRHSTALAPAICRVWLEVLLQHGTMLSEHLELHAANNHLLLEAKALALLGLALPELRPARHWRDRGLKLLWAAVRAQVCPDGVHDERVSHYQQVISGELLEMCVWLENNGQQLPPDIRERLAQMVVFEQHLTKPDGTLPLLGDSGHGDAHLRFRTAAAGPIALRRPDLRRASQPLTEADYWLLGPQRVKRARALAAGDVELASREFPQGGCIVMRAGRGPQASHLVFDTGPFGSSQVPVHGHADALSLELSAYGEAWLVDPGGFAAWVPQNWRNYFRGTRAHTTVVVDEADQSLLIGPRRVYRPAQVKRLQWFTHQQVDLADAQHDGYQRLAAPITHRRQVCFLKPDCWIVIDRLEGRGVHTFDLLFHFAPGQALALEAATGLVRAGQPGGPSLTVLPVGHCAATAEIITGATDPIQGWAAPYSGSKEPAPVLRYRHQGPAPVELCTVLCAAPAGSAAPLTAATLEVRPTPGQPAWPEGQVTGLIIDQAETRHLVVLDRGPQPARKCFDQHQSQASFAYVRQHLPGGETTSLVES